jgi:glycosyltransferase involved in cell wall biosynthesis
MSSTVPSPGQTKNLPVKNANELPPKFERADRPGVFLMTDSFNTGGSERQFVTLAGSLDPALFRVEVGCIQKTGGFLRGFEDAAQFPLHGNAYGFGSWRMRFRLGSHLRRKQIAIAHAFDFYTNLVLIPAARLARIPVVIGSQRQIGDLLSPMKAQAQLATFRFCDRIICNSKAAADRLTEQGIGRRRVVVIGNGLPPSAFAAHAPALPRQPGVLRVGMIARMNTWAKNHKLFLQAAAKVSARVPDVQFVLVGDGPLRAELEQETQRLGIAAQTLFLGDRRDIPAILASLDVSVLPSDSESLSNAIIESMAAGVPAIASDVGGNPELLGHGRGLLVKPGDEQALADAMASVLLDAGRRAAMGENGKKFAAENFTIEHMRRRHEELYAELLEEKQWQLSHREHFIPAEPQGRKTKVAIVAASLRYVGGQSVQADTLLRSWQNDPEIDATLIAIDPPFPKALQWIERIPGLRTLVRQPLYMRDLWRGLKDADIAHIFSASYWSFLIAPAPAWLVARQLGKKSLINYHSGEARDHFEKFHSALAVLKRVDKIIVPSQFLVDVFRDFGLEAGAVPNVVDLSQFKFRARNPLRPHLVCTRGFHPYYSVDIVVRAFAEVTKQYPEARLDLVGGGPQEAEIRRLASELKLPGIHFAGVASRQEIHRYYDQADIFINASWLDNMPVSILEAFAAGTPVVTTAPEGIRYMVDDERTGLLSPPGDAEALARNVLRVVRDPELAGRLAANAFEESKRYEWSAVRGQWASVYESLHRGQDSH